MTVASLLVSLLLTGAGTAYAADDDPPLLDYAANVELRAVADMMPEFGGAYFDEEGTLVVWTLDSGAGDLEAAYADALMMVYGDDLAARGQYVVDQESDPPAAGTPPQLTLKEAQFSVHELLDWHHVLKEQAPEGVVSIDVDEQTNRIRVFLADDASEDQVAVHVEALGLPTDALIFSARRVYYSQATVRDYHPVLHGGTQIEQGPFLCTMGFPAVFGNRKGMITNSHCTQVQGSLDSGAISQGGTFIGRESIDPPYDNCVINATPSLCRNSDSAFILYDDQTRFHNNIIAKPVSANTGALAMTGAPFRILSEGPPAAAPEPMMPGELIHKVGRTTGWTTGRVNAIDMDVRDGNTPFVYLDQVQVDALRGVATPLSQDGDSGAPWFRIRAGAANGAELLGIHWGGNPAGTSSVFSPLDNIKQDLGPIQVLNFGPEPPSCGEGEECCWINDDPGQLGDGSCYCAPEGECPDNPFAGCGEGEVCCEVGHDGCAVCGTPQDCRDHIAR